MSTPATFASVTLETPRLTLREFAEGDAEAIQFYAGDPEVTRFTSWGPNTPDTTAAVLASWLQDRKLSPRTEWTLAIVRKENGILIGSTGFGMTDWNSGTANFGYVLQRSAWGKGYATEASRTVVDLALNELGLRRLIAHCEPAHAASLSVLNKLGFSQDAPVALPRMNGEMRSYLTFVKERP
jgi:ribosomal-protein-alanine N-acetyltransferase